MKVKREELLHALEVVAPGLSAKEITVQSTHVAFDGKSVLAFNGEVCVRAPCPGKLSGAVVGAKLIEALHRLPDDEVIVESDGKELRVSGKGRRFGVAMEAEVSMQLEHLQPPSKWSALPDGFADACRIVAECSSKDRGKEPLDCVHLTPKWLEASDSYRAIRHKLRTSLEANVLVKAEHLKQLLPLDMTEVSMTANWCHFRNPAGVTFSCLLVPEDFTKCIDVGDVLKREGGTPLTLPPQLEEGCKLAEVFSKENASGNNVVEVLLRPGRLRLRGEGINGWAEKRMGVKYDGPEMSFLIPPQMLVELSKKTSLATVGEGWMTVASNAWRFVVVLDNRKQGEE